MNEYVNGDADYPWIVYTKKDESTIQFHMKSKKNGIIKRQIFCKEIGCSIPRTFFMIRVKYVKHGLKYL